MNQVRSVKGRSFVGRILETIDHTAHVHFTVDYRQLIGFDPAVSNRRETNLTVVRNLEADIGTQDRIAVNIIVNTVKIETRRI